MLDAFKRAIILVTAPIVALLALALAPYNANWLWLLVLTVPLVLLGIYDWQQKT